jgi:hypothetical protein
MSDRSFPAALTLSRSHALTLSRAHALTQLSVCCLRRLTLRACRRVGACWCALVCGVAADREQLMHAFAEENFSAGQDIIKQGDSGDKFYILCSGVRSP